MKYTSRIFSVALVLGAVTTVVWLRGAERPVPAAEPVAEALVGVWVHVGEPGHVGPIPRTGARLKFRIGQRWTYTQTDEANRMVKAHFGGTYRVRGDEYAETVDYSTDPDDSELGRTLVFKVKVEGDTMTQTGVNNPYTEVWQRLR
jgi:hypothetical protein